MPRYQVGYTNVSTAASAAFPTRTGTHRPVLPVTLTNVGLIWPCYAVVDSGADDILFPASFAANIGLKLESGALYQFGGVGSSNQPAWFFLITLNIRNVTSYQIPVGFTPALELAGVGLLGQNGFFDTFKVEFDLPHSVFYLETI